MIKIFPNSFAECIKCHTPLSGDVKFIGGNAYCSEHYEKELEKPDTEKKRKDLNWFTKHFDISR